MRKKYSTIARFYDLLSAEYPVYRAGRLLGIELLRLRPGQQVLDVGCGTGLNFALLQKEIGREGVIVGLDSSAEMLAQARHRARRQGWTNVILIQADATSFSAAEVRAQIVAQGGREFADAALATYSLSLMRDRELAWSNMMRLVFPAAWSCVVDMQEPRGRYAFVTPLARLACRLGGSDINARPWQALERDCKDVASASARGGHIQVRAGRCGTS
jgi:S-adenosylmethionine-diacylgycerolhomoserine-N-methlytransferase